MYVGLVLVLGRVSALGVSPTDILAFSSAGVVGRVDGPVEGVMCGLVTISADFDPCRASWTKPALLGKAFQSSISPSRM